MTKEEYARILAAGAREATIVEQEMKRYPQFDTPEEKKHPTMDLSMLLNLQSGVFQLLSGPVVVYVGKTHDILGSIAQARRVWPGEFSRVLFAPMRPSEQLHERARLIAIHQPRLNVKQALVHARLGRNHGI